MEFYSFAQLCNQGYTRRSILHRAKMFKHIQVLVALLNGFHKGPLMLAIMAASIFVLAFTLSTLVKNSGLDIMFIFTIFIIVTDCVLVTLVVFGQMATVYIKSKNALHVITCKKTLWLPVNLQKTECKFYKSCKPLKIMIGSVNLVDSLTPLNILQHSITITANILLLGGKEV